MREFNLVIAENYELENTAKSYEELLQEYKFVYHVHESLANNLDETHKIVEHDSYHLFSNCLLHREEIVCELLGQLTWIEYDCIHYIVAVCPTKNEYTTLDIFTEEEGQKYL